MIEQIHYLPNFFIGFMKIKVAISTTALLSKRKCNTVNQKGNWDNRNSICKKNQIFSISIYSFIKILRLVFVKVLVSFSHSFPVPTVISLKQIET